MNRITRLAAVAGCALATAGAAGPATAAAAPETKGQQQRANDILDVIFALRHDPGLHRFVRAVSDPSSPRYRAYRPFRAQVKAFGASAQTRTVALRWAAERGLDAEVGASGTFVHARGTAAEVAAAFGGASLRARGGAVVADPAVPAELRGAVTGVSVTDDRPVFEPQAAPPASKLPRSGTPAGCPEGVATGGFTPNQWLQAYGLADLHERGLTGKGIRVGVIEIDGYDRADVDTYAACFGLPEPTLKRHLIGTKKPLAPGVETPLDLQVLTAGAPGLDGIDVYEGNGTNLGILAGVLTALASKDAPQVISISLGGCETNDSLDTGTARELNTAFAMAAGAGVSVFVSSGDQGSTPCTDGNKVPIPAFSASFPASSQYVTAVGGTNLALTKGNRISNEIVWNESAAGEWAATGGGFSSIFGRPWYQRAVVEPSLSSGTTRIVPDVAALADTMPGYAYFCDGQECLEELGQVGWQTVGGTSAAAPLMAAGAALINQAAAKAGQPPIGFANPLIYTLADGKRGAQVLRDVTTGGNDVGVLAQDPVGTGQPFGCCSASKGFDEVSGWGSLRMAAFADAALRAGR